MSITRQSLLILSILCVGVFIAGYRSGELSSIPLLSSPSQILVPVTQGEKLVLAPMVISVHEVESRKHQDVAIALFMAQVETSQFPLEDIQIKFTPDGFLASIQPVFAPTKLPWFAHEEVRVFVRGDGFIEQCYPAQVDECAWGFATKNLVPQHSFTKVDDNPLMPPQMIVVVYGMRTTPT